MLTPSLHAVKHKKKNEEEEEEEKVKHKVGELMSVSESITFSDAIFSFEPEISQ